MEYRCLKDGMSVRETVESADFAAEYDVVVAGLGTAGAVAALTAANRGVSVLGLEAAEGLGGLGTLGCIWDYFFGSFGGVQEKLIAEAQRLTHDGYTRCSPLSDERGSRFVNGSAMEAVLEHEILQSGCTVWLNTPVVGVYTEGKRIVGVSCLHDGVLTAVKTKVVIDTTGDVRTAAFMGLPLFNGRASDGRRMLCSRTSVRAYGGGLTRFSSRNDESLYRLTSEERSRFLLNLNGRGGTLTGCGDGNRIVQIASMLGEREGTRIRGETTLTLETVLSLKPPEKPMFDAFSPLDVVETQMTLYSEQFQFWRIVCRMHGVYGVSTAVPMGAMLPADSEGLIVAGLGMSFDDVMVGCLRMKKDMHKSGEAAAILASTAVSLHCDVRDVPYEPLADDLHKSGCLAETAYLGVCKVSPDMMSRERAVLPTDTASWRRILDSNEYGILLFAMRSGLLAPNREAILSVMQGENTVDVRGENAVDVRGENAVDVRGEKVKNAVYAAAVAGYAEAIEPLIAILEQPEEIHKNPAVLASIEMSDEAVAVFLLGELKAVEALPVLQRRRGNPLERITADECIRESLLFDMRNLIDNAIAKISVLLCNPN